MRYFFNTQNGHLVCDDEGLELADLATAKREAVQFLGEILLRNQDFFAEETLSVTVVDGNGRSLWIAQLTGRPVQ